MPQHTEPAQAGTGNDLITAIDDYLHAAPRSGATALEVGPFTLFRSTTAWPYYARPRPGVRPSVRLDDLARLREVCDSLDLPFGLEWLGATAPELARVAEQAGLTVTEHPLLAVEPADFRPVPAPGGVALRLVPAELDALLDARAVAEVGFGNIDGATGPAGPAERAAARENIRPALADALLQRTSAGVAVGMAAHATGLDPAGGPVSCGTYHPVGPAAEIVGVATLPSARHRGLATAVTSALTAHAFAHGVGLVLLSAQDERVARIYRGLGFHRLSTAGAAE